MTRSAPNRAAWAMESWAAWITHRTDTGYPPMSSEARAAQAAQTATRTDGVARYRGTVELTNGKRVKKQPPPMPKETRPQAHSITPRIDKAKLGPHVDRLLHDMMDNGRAVEVSALVASVRGTGAPQATGLTDSGYWKALRRGRQILGRMMGLDQKT